MQSLNAGWAVMRIATILASFAMTATAAAAPYYITHTGTISDSEFGAINNGQAYTVTLVFDNGTSGTASQTWGASHLTCVLWTMNSGANVTYTQNLAVTQGTLYTVGSIVTDAGGALTSNFVELNSDDPPAGTYSSTGFTPARPIGWFLNDQNDIFYDGNQIRSFGDAAGGVQMAVGYWSNPQPYAGTCPVTAAVPAAVPTLTEWGAMLMSGLLALSALLAHRRRRQTRR